MTKGKLPLRRPKLSKNHKRRRIKLENYMKLIGIDMIENSNYIRKIPSEKVPRDADRYWQGAEYHRFSTLEECIKDNTWVYTAKIRFWGQ